MFYTHLVHARACLKPENLSLYEVSPMPPLTTPFVDSRFFPFPVSIFETPLACLNSSQAPEGPLKVQC